jgi:sRNA-binding regulator protein Hfq
MSGKGKTRAPEQTMEEAKYLQQLVDGGNPVRVRLTDNSELDGVVEFYDEHFIRLTRKGAPNLFVYKHDIKYLHEVPE